LTAVATFAADAASFGLKDLVHRTRPFDRHPEIHPLYVVHSSSFPAGHVATAFAGATLLTYVAPRAMPLFTLLAVAIGYSRVYVGVHYPGDVVGGAIIGTAIGACAIVLLIAASRKLGFRAGLAETGDELRVERRVRAPTVQTAERSRQGQGALDPLAAGKAAKRRPSVGNRASIRSRHFH
jgi:membrane-associated phospholipid phosphatase